jgi:hypothetical protein
MGELYYRMFDNKLCSKDSCLGCKKVETCTIFRAQYERKKRSIQLERYEQAEEQASQKESQELTEEQIEKLLEPHISEILNERGQLSVPKMRVWLRTEGIRLSSWKAYQIKGNIEGSHPELFAEA